MSRDAHSGISEQRKASVHRMTDAEKLFEAERWRGAMYLAGYSLECRLKCRLMEKLQCPTLQQLESELRD